MSPYCTMSVVEPAHLKGLADATAAIMRGPRRGGYTPVRFCGYYRKLICRIFLYLLSPDVDPALVSAESGLRQGRGLQSRHPTYGKYDLTGFGGLSCAMLSAPSGLPTWATTTMPGIAM